MTKYRGLRLDGKGWVEGYYYKNHRTNQHAIKPNNDLQNWDDAAIHPESLSLFTGLTDKNGVEMFSKSKAIYKGIEGTIEWEQQAAAFWFKWNEKSESGRVFHKYKELSATVCIDGIYQCDYIEIIGNQYEQNG